MKLISNASKVYHTIPNKSTNHTIQITIFQRNFLFLCGGYEKSRSRGRGDIGGAYGRVLVFLSILIQQSAIIGQDVRLRHVCATDGTHMPFALAINQPDKDT